jgi:hypothetical protein
MSKFTESQNIDMGHLTGTNQSGPNDTSLNLDGPSSPPSGRGSEGTLVMTEKKQRKRDFGFLPIPKSRRHNPNLKPEEQFIFTWRMNLVFATAAVSLARSYVALLLMGR